MLKDFMAKNLSVDVSRREIFGSRISATGLFCHIALLRKLELDSKLDGHTGTVSTVRWNATGSLLVSGSEDLKIKIWDYGNRAILHSFDSRHTGDIFCVQFVGSTDDNVVSGGGDCIIRHSNLERQTSRSLCCHKGRVKSLAAHPLDPTVFVSASEDGTVRLHDLRIKHKCPAEQCPNVLVDLRQKPRVLRPGRQKVDLHSVAIDPLRDHYLAVGGGDPIVRIYDRRKLNPSAAHAGGDRAVMQLLPSKLHNRRQASQCCITSVTYKHDGSQLLASYRGDDMYLFDTGHMPPPLLDILNAWTVSTPTPDHQHAKRKFQATSSAKAPSPSTPSVAFDTCGPRSTSSATTSEPRTASSSACVSPRSAPKSVAHVLTNDKPGLPPTLEKTVALPVTASHSQRRRVSISSSPAEALPPSIFQNPPPTPPAPTDHPMRDGPPLTPSALPFSRCASSPTLTNLIASPFPSSPLSQTPSRSPRSQRDSTSSGALLPPPTNPQQPPLPSPQSSSPAASFAATALGATTPAHSGVAADADAGEGSVGNASMTVGVASTSRSDSVVSEDLSSCGFDERSADEGPSSRHSSVRSVCEQPTDGRSAPDDTTYVRCFAGARNRLTSIKDVAFLGHSSEYVMSPSDDGRVFIWHATTGALVQVLAADMDIVNCVRPHPHHLSLASCGTEHCVKLWSPTADTSATLASFDKIVNEATRRRYELEDQGRFQIVPAPWLAALQQLHPTPNNNNADCPVS